MEKALIIEDDPEACERLKKMLKEVAPELSVAGHCSSVKETLKWLRQHPLPELIFSVVQLPDGLSFAILKRLQYKVPVIFICRYDKFAVKAFRANGVFYIVKPVKKAELQEAIEKYRTHFARRPVIPPQSPVPSHYQERFLISSGLGMLLIKAGDIAYCYTENKVVYLVTFEGKKYVSDQTLEQLQHQLNPCIFFRINRQFIVNVSAIVEMAPASKSRLSLTLRPSTDRKTITSFERTDRFRKWILGNYDVSHSTS